jgi:hypothetical protein
MKRTVEPYVLTHEVARFASEVRGMAYAIVLAAIDEEIARRRAPVFRGRGRGAAATPPNSATHAPVAKKARGAPVAKKARPAPAPVAKKARPAPAPVAKKARPAPLGDLPPKSEQLALGFDADVDRRLVMQGDVPTGLVPTVEPATTAHSDAPDAPDVPASPAAAVAPAPACGKAPAWGRDRIVAELAALLASGTAIDARFVARHGPPGLAAATRRMFGRFDAALNVAALHLAKLYPDGVPNRRVNGARTPDGVSPRLAHGPVGQPPTLDPPRPR